MGDLPPPQAVFHENLSQTLRYLLGHRKQLLRDLFVYSGCHYSEVFQEVQKDGVRGDDDIPTKHAYERVVLRGPGDCNCGSLCLSELFRKMINLILERYNKKSLSHSPTIWINDSSSLALQSLYLFQRDYKFPFDIPQLIDSFLLLSYHWLIVKMLFIWWRNFI